MKIFYRYSTLFIGVLGMSTLVFCMTLEL